MFYPVTVSSTACRLLAAEPDWSTAVTGEFAARTASDSGLSARGHRRRLAAQTVLTLAWSSLLDGPGHAAMRVALGQYANEPVLVPFWPGETALDDLGTSSWSGSLRVFFEPDWSQWEVAPSTQAEPFGFAASGDCRVAPLLWGRFAKLPAPPEAITARGAQYSWSVTESGPAETAIRAVATLASGPSLGTATPRLLELEPDWGGAVASGGVELRIERDRVGYGRAEVEYFVAHTPARRLKASLTPLGEETARLVALFQDRGGSAGLLWAPGQWHEAALALASSSGSQVVTLDEAAPLDSETAVWISDGSHSVARRIQSRSGQTLTLAGAPGAFAAGTPVSALWLCRFSGDVLRVAWETPAVATSTIELVELPAEAALPDGETQGSTVGDLGGVWWGYLVSDGVVTWRFTSHDSAIDAGALGTFEPRPIDHGDIEQELNLARHDVSLALGSWDGSPFERWRTDRSAPQLLVQIFEGNTAAPSAARLIFSGRARTARYSGATATVPVRGPSALFDLKGPVAIVSKRCWAPFGGSACGVDLASVSTEADLAEASADGKLHFVAAGTSTWPVRPRDYYRHGYIERTLADGTFRRIRIAASEAVRDETIPPVGTLDPAASAWQSEALAYGGTLGTDTLAICNQLAASLRGTSAWSKIIYLAPFLGTNLAAASTPLVNRLGWPRPTMYNLTDNDVGDALGIRKLTTSGYLRIDLPAALRPRNIGVGMWRLAGAVSLIGDSSGAYLYVRSTGAVTFTYGGFSVYASGTLSPAAARLGHWYGTASLSSPYGELFHGGQLFATAPRTGTQDNGQWHDQHYLFGGSVESSEQLGVSYVTSGQVSAAEAAELHDVLEAALMVPTGRSGAPSRRLSVTPAVRVPALPAVFPAPGWRIVPGCDKSLTACAAYANRHRFRGFPHLPKSNPALVAVSQTTSSSGKK
ncbi:DUF2163 domain-containing protein [Ruficoccus amylovorans]|uniref:DUF2163 domain-containing protein n=1 Tax=Ruficoccus amylovorans TaxID=1804625 RepID=A0A842H8J8_9BACT|nr:phage BR0599 family protein [Ruficoccus amylovorans]MBC2592702.1 DUF2163 domain-containing protein [Ruficoccus amylovorans]